MSPRRPTNVDRKAGDLVRLGEDDYKYGVGPLALRVSRVRDDLSHYYNGEWIWLEGIEIRSRGDGPARQVLVRASALTSR